MINEFNGRVSFQDSGFGFTIPDSNGFPGNYGHDGTGRMKLSPAHLLEQWRYDWPTTS